MVIILFQGLLTNVLSCKENDFPMISFSCILRMLADTLLFVVVIVIRPMKQLINTTACNNYVLIIQEMCVCIEAIVDEVSNLVPIG